MKRIFQFIIIAGLTCMLSLIFSLKAIAQEAFVPTPPAEPGQMGIVALSVNPKGAATVSGGGKYSVGTRRTVSTSPTHARWRFSKWTNADTGTTISTSSSVSVTWPAGVYRMTANYEEVDTFKVVVLADPAEAASLSGSGTYAYSASAYTNVRATAKTGYRFKNWTRNGAVISTSTSFNYYPTNYGIRNATDTLIAHFDYVPSTPAEPDADKARISRYVNVSVEPATAGYTNFTQKIFYDGDQVSLKATNYADYKFVSWTQDGIVVSYDKDYSFRMGKKELNFQANFIYAPGTPSEPEAVEVQTYGIYVGSSEIYVGQSAFLPISMENSADVDSLAFTISLPNTFEINGEQSTFSPRMNSPEFTMQRVERGDSIDFHISLKDNGGAIKYNNGVVMNLMIEANDTVYLGTYDAKLSKACVAYQQKKISEVLMHDGSLTVLKPLPSGRKGDVNDDGRVNERDLILLKTIIVRFPKGQDEIQFNFDNADMDCDGRINGHDWALLQQLVGNLKQENGNIHGGN